MSASAIKRFAEAWKADPYEHNVGCSAWERKTGASLTLWPEALLDLVATLEDAKKTIRKLNDNRKEALDSLKLISTERFGAGSYAERRISEAEELLSVVIKSPWLK